MARSDAVTRTWLDSLLDSTAVTSLVDAIGPGGPGTKATPSPPHLHADGSRGSSTHLVAGAVAVRSLRPVLLVVAHLDEADDALDDLDLFPLLGQPLRVMRLPALEVLPGESGPNLDLVAERLAVVAALSAADAPDVLVAPIQALMQEVPTPDALSGLVLKLREGQEIAPTRLAGWLTDAGYTRQDAIENAGDFSIRGGIVDLFPAAGHATDSSGRTDAVGPVRLDYFGDEIESIQRIDPDTLGSAGRLESVRIIAMTSSNGTASAPVSAPKGQGTPAQAAHADGDATTSLLDLLPGGTVCLLHEPLELAEQARGYFHRLTLSTGVEPPNTVFQKLTAGHLASIEVNQYGSSGAAAIHLPVDPLPPFDPDAKRAVHELGELAMDEGNDVRVLCRKLAERDRLIEMMDDLEIAGRERIAVELGTVHRGFVWRRDEGAGGRRDEDAERSSETPARRGRGAGHAGGETGPKPAYADSAGAVRAGQSPPSLPLRPSVPSSLGPSLLLIPHHELFHRYETRRRVRQVTGGQEVAAGVAKKDAFLDLDIGDYVVHIDHGIARFTGLKTLKRGGESAEYLTLEFAQKSLLHVPATQIDLVQKYIGGFQGRPPLSVLGGKRWDRQKENVAGAVKQMAAQLLRLQAARETQPGIRYPADTRWQREFEAEFPYEETQDQIAAISGMKRDMSESRPMDRLICGDVGFGKTEVAIRGAFKACEFGKQVAVLVPTTVLAEQHERTFRGRMADYPFRVESLSRFKSAAEQRETLKRVKRGEVDIVIGTHRLLSKDVEFSDLGLVIIDEEQRFGVEHKNRLLELRLTADVLTLTATPIPRTLHMAMIGLRDISSLSTPPVDRRAIVTEVVAYDEGRIKNALVREMNRGGQAFFVHNRVHNIQSVADDIKRLVPDARIVIGHGQMPPGELEEVMLKFMRHDADILVSTTIIESGIDIPTANTMFINQADHFGLAELHQLRGRVGRYKHRAYCYLLLPPDRTISEVAIKRLRALEQYSMLGAGFKIAMRDLEIRGAGNLLGAEQSGHIAAVGYEMYCTLLEQAASRLSGDVVVEPARTHLELPGVPGSLPKRYITSDKHRMDAYRRLSRATSVEELDAVVHDLTDAFGEPPPAAERLVDLTQVRILASHAGLMGIKRDGPDLILTHPPEAAGVEERFAKAPGRTTRLTPTTLYWRPPGNYLDPPETLLAVLRKVLAAG